MTRKLSYSELLTDEEWGAVRDLIDKTGRIEAVVNVLNHIRLIGAKSVIVEEEYIDMDFSFEFSAFYSKIFRRYAKLCKRLHFFSEKISDILSGNSGDVIFKKFDDFLGHAIYLGFLVLRPLEHAPIGRTVLSPPDDFANFRSHISVKTKYNVHLLGCQLSVEGIPFIQQDSRVGACAHASIWMSGRHFHARHSEPWISMVEIAEKASNPADAMLAQSLPAGSGGIGVSNMVRALRAMGRQPLLYAAKTDFKSQPPTNEWPPSLNPVDIIDRYVDSSIPVILILTPWDGGDSAWHAVTCVGEARRSLSSGPPERIRPTRAIFCDSFYVHDDQRGCYLRMPVSEQNVLAQTPYCVEKYVQSIIVPLPGKVFIQAESADRISWDFLEYYSDEWNNIVNEYSDKLENSISFGNNIVTKIQNRKIISRTYLTFGWKYKYRILRNIISAQVKERILLHPLPRFVWVTEFGLFDSLNKDGPQDKRIFAHSVVDATSSHFWNGLLAFHAPGCFWFWAPDSHALHPSVPTGLDVIPDDHEYLPRVRGRLPF